METNISNLTPVTVLCPSQKCRVFHPRPFPPNERVLPGALV